MASFSDLTFLKSFTGSDTAKITKYVMMFLNSTPKCLEDIKLYHSKQDWKSLKTAAHTLKSQLKYMGVSKAEELATTIERNAGDQTNLDQLGALIPDLESITLQACDELKDELTRL